MNLVTAFLGQVSPYIVAGVFLAGIGFRLWAWAHVPVPFRIALSPDPKTGRGVAGSIVAETLLFRSLFRGGKEGWAGAWVFHAALALTLVGHFFGIALLAKQFTLLGASEEASKDLSALFGSIAGILLLATLAYLFARRIAIPYVRIISFANDYFVVILLVAIALTGGYMRLLTETDLAPIRDYVGGLLAFNPPPLPDNPMFAVHFSLVQLLLLYFPFSKLMHSCGVFFTRALVTAKALRTGEVA